MQAWVPVDPWGMMTLQNCQTTKPKSGLDRGLGLGTKTWNQYSEVYSHQMGYSQNLQTEDTFFVKTKTDVNKLNSHYGRIYWPLSAEYSDCLTASRISSHKVNALSCQCRFCCIHVLQHSCIRTKHSFPSMCVWYNMHVSEPSIPYLPRVSGTTCMCQN